MTETHLPDDLNVAPAKQTYAHAAGQESFLRRVLIVSAVAALTVVALWVLWNALVVFLLVFGGILLGVLLRALSDGLRRVTHLPDRLSVGIVITLLTVLTAGLLWWIGPRVAAQFGELGETLGSAQGEVRQTLRQYPWGEQLLEWLPSFDQLVSQAERGLTRTGIFSNITGMVSRSLEVLSGLLIVLFAGVFFAFEPGLYMRGLVWLFPQNRRGRVWEVLRAEEHTLRWWLMGTAISMAIAGVLSGLALWFLGVPLAFTLGFLTALLEFVPYIGPLLATIPAVLLGLTVSPQTALWVLVVYALIQALESNVILPLVLKKTVELPPVVTLTVQVLLGVLAGALGVLFATPLAAAAMVLVQMVYVEDILGNPMDIQKTGD